MSKPDKNIALCFVCNEPIPNDRLEALVTLGKPKRDWTHVKCSVEKRKKGIYMGEHGTSELKLVARVYNDSVRDMFSKSDEEEPKESKE